MTRIARQVAPKPVQPGQCQDGNEEQAEILARFSPEERAKIQHGQKLLSALGYFIGKDFAMPILLNQPGAGWHWSFKKHHIKIDPLDLLNKPLDHLRFVISHEAGHRRITRTDFIPDEIWRQPGFAFMMSAIEDARDNNFVAEAYPRFREQMNIAYRLGTQFEEEARKAAATRLGTLPRFLQAGQAYIKLWFNEANGKPLVVDERLPIDVRETVQKTIAAARESWWRYPSREEADQSEELISRYAEASYRINLERIWPEFRKLVDEDIKDQQTKQVLDDMQPREETRRESGGISIPQELEEMLSAEEFKEVERIMKSAGIAEAKAGPVDPSALTPELKQKILEYVDSLSPQAREDLRRRARAGIRALEEEINQALEAKHAAERKDAPQSKAATAPASVTAPEPAERSLGASDVSAVREKLESLLAPGSDAYDIAMRELLPLINRLEDDLRQIFVERQARPWDSGHKFGKKIDLKRRIQEKAKSVSAFASRAWLKRAAPAEKDYAITLLVDLSGSMRGEKIAETFKAVIVLAEVLNALSIKMEILGFNDRIHHFQDFGVRLTDATRREMGGMLLEVDSEQARYNDDGWALRQASARLAREEAEEKFLIAFSDGTPKESQAHCGYEFNLRKVVEEIVATTDQKLIGLGIGGGTSHVASYYPNSLADIPVKAMAENLADLIRDVITNYRDFSHFNLDKP